MAVPNQSLLTPAVKALIGQSTEVTEMYGVIDQETVRRHICGIPDQDPRHWDEEVAGPRYGGTTTPPLLVTYVGGRKPPWEPDTMHQLMLEDWHRDGAGMQRQMRGLPSIRSVAPTRSHLNGGEEVELFRYAKIGDRIFFQTRYVDIQEKVGRDGRPFLLVIRETRYWNQDDETICIVRNLGIERP
ncbi:MAG TPA: MaoC family dehydratase N-terminal domain-containing protein [Dehalococcoidia bacterium]|nr:MaoC family dehydratase N-terminal domain-containing protein [Dehalococcoidia bacterium]